MSLKKTIENLTPAHFENGADFDQKVFSSLIDGLLKQRSNAWKIPVIWIAGMLLASVFAASGGAIGYFMSVVCIFAGIIGGNLSVMGIVKQIKAAKKELGITQHDINLALKKVKTELEQQGVTKTTNSVEIKQKPIPTKTKSTRRLLIISSISVLLIHALMFIVFVVNAIDGDSKTEEYSIFAIGNVLAIIGVVMMIKKRLWAYALVVLGIVLFCVGMGDELNDDGAIIILVLMSIFSVMLLFATLWQRSENLQEASRGEPKSLHLNTWKYLLLAMSATVAVILITLLLSRGKYENTYWAYDLYQAQLRSTGKWGFLDRDKKQEVVPCIYDETDRTYYILKVKLDGKWGAFSKDGNQIVPCRYDFIGNELSDSLLYIRDNNKHGLIHFDGREIVPCMYNEQLRSNSSTDLLKAVIDGKYGFIDRNGAEIIPIEYDNADFIVGRGFWADLKGEKIYFDQQGQMVDNDLTAIAQVQASKSNGKMMKVSYNSQDKTFTFTDTDAGKTLKYNYIMIGNTKPVEMRYYYSQHGGSMIQFVTKAKQILDTWQENGQTVTRYSEESTTSFPLNNELPYTLDEGVLTIKR